MVLLAALLVASTGCTPIPDLQPSHPQREHGGEGDRPPLDTGTVDTGVEGVPSSEETRDDALFTLDKVHTADLEMAADALDSLRADPYTLVPADLVLDGVRFRRIGVRLKGHLGSYRSLDGKSGFKIDADAFVDGQHIYGLEKLNLSNMVQDSAQVHDHMAYMLYREVGIPAPRTGYAWVTVNGTDYGLYSLIEAYDEAFLERSWGDASGNLYDGDYHVNDDGSYFMLDFESSTHDWFALDEGTDVGHADVHAVSAALLASPGAYTDVMSAVVDVDHHLLMWATEVWVGQYDGYTYNRNNYRIYFHPADGLARLMPWDHDWAFYASTPLTSPSGLLSRYCKGDDACYTAFGDALARVCRVADTTDLAGELDAAVALIAPYVEADPRKERSAADIQAGQEELRAWFASRTATLEAMEGL